MAQCPRDQDFAAKRGDLPRIPAKFELQNFDGESNAELTVEEPSEAATSISIESSSDRIFFRIMPWFTDDAPVV